MGAPLAGRVVRAMPVSESVPAYLRLEIHLERVRSTGSRSHRRPFPAPVVRGMLGKALVDRFCPFGEPRCDPKGAKRASLVPARGERRRLLSASDLCLLAAACPYGVLFAASRTRRPPFALFVPTLQVEEGAEAGADEELDSSIELTLYGAAWSAYAWILQALQDALAERIGERGGWRIGAVRRIRPDRSAEPLTGSDLRALPADLPPDLLGLAPEPFLAPAPVAVELRSPTHLLLRGKPTPRDLPIPFDLLVKSTLDRFAGLFGEDSSPVIAKEIRSVVEAEAAKVPLLEQDVRAADGSHHSRRSSSRLDLGGTVGRLLYGPQAASFFHILRAAEVLHLGKNPTFGCGRIQVDLS